MYVCCILYVHRYILYITPECVWSSELQFSTVVVSQNEGEDWILHEVIESPSCQLVQFHQVLKVGDLSLLPAGVEKEREG